MEFYIIVNSRTELILDAVQEALAEGRRWSDKPTAMMNCEKMEDHYEVRKMVIWSSPEK